MQIYINFTKLLVEVILLSYNLLQHYTMIQSLHGLLKICSFGCSFFPLIIFVLEERFQLFSAFLLRLVV